MFGFCADPASLEGGAWLVCYLTNGVHWRFYGSFLTVLLLLAVTAPCALAFGFAGAMASRSRIAPVRWIGRLYTAMVRGVPDIAFFPLLCDRAGPGARMAAAPRTLPGLDRSNPARGQLPCLPRGKIAVGISAPIGPRSLQLHSGRLHIRSGVWRLCRKRPFRCDESGAQGPN